MTIVRPLVDAEAAVSRLLRADPEVADLVDDRVYTELPVEKVWPMARVFRVGGAPDAWPYHVDRADLQIDAWGGSKRDAHTLIETAMRALVKLRVPGAWRQLDPEVAALGVLASVSFFGLLWLPDADVPARSGAPRPRYLVTASTVLRPAPS